MEKRIIKNPFIVMPLVLTFVAFFVSISFKLINVLNARSLSMRVLGIVNG
jgi:hypothetical protein